MAVKYQFNKISLQALRKQLAIRESALPILKSKESALRLTVKKYKTVLDDLKDRYKKKIESINNFKILWAEFPLDVFTVKSVITQEQKIAGVKIPTFVKLSYEIKDFSRFLNYGWITSGVEVLKEVSELIAQIKVTEVSVSILERARKKTTQKVNLYEKVQIPQYSEAIRKIKRFLEDVDNLEKSAQKITKQKQITG